MMNRSVFVLLFLFLFAGCKDNLQSDQVWTAKKAKKWQHHTGWLVGCNYIPSTAINQLEMWQEETFDTVTINKELTLAEGLGFNIIRVFLHDMVWTRDPQGMKQRMDKFLSIASRHKIGVMFVLFDDCWNEDPKLGKQPDPIPGKHNSGWVQSPGRSRMEDSILYSFFEKYVKGTITAFGNDPRVWIWDLYNEPGNSGHYENSIPLLKLAFKWAREVKHIQPLTSAVWNFGKEFKDIDSLQLHSSDIISFHNYGDTGAMRACIKQLKVYERPLLCSEYMARTAGSKFQTHLPLLKKEKVGAINWGLVSGKTQTIFPWSSPKGASEPLIWFHDIFRSDGSSFDKTEVECIKSMTKK
jgi:hypothetical protein